MLKVLIEITGEVEGHGGREGHNHLERIKRSIKSQFRSSRVSVKIVAESCDVCGDWVDMTEDPIFAKHNCQQHARHLAISRGEAGPGRIIV